MSVGSRQPREFTGRHMLVITLAFFGVVIVVNVTMAVLANTSWTGLVVENTYVASQEFNGKAQEGREQAALGWTARFAVADGKVNYGLLSKGGDPIRLDGVTVLFRHPAYDKEDEQVVLTPAGDGSWTGKHTPHDGVWIVEIDAEAGLSHPYRDVRRVYVKDGVIR